VRLKPEQTLSADELTAFCTGKIATFKIPRYWKFVTEFPITVTGKVQKFRMREVSVQELGLQLVAATRTA
jgi:fatty-acyl-CoA synthase